MQNLIAWLDAERGRRKKLADELGIFPSALSQWTRIPEDRVLDVERVTGINRHELRPDLSAIFISKEPSSNGEAA